MAKDDKKKTSDSQKKKGFRGSVSRLLGIPGSEKTENDPTTTAQQGQIDTAPDISPEKELPIASQFAAVPHPDPNYMSSTSQSRARPRTGQNTPPKEGYRKVTAVTENTQPDEPPPGRHASKAVTHQFALDEGSALNLSDNDETEEQQQPSEEDLSTPAVTKKESAESSENEQESLPAPPPPVETTQQTTQAPSAPEEGPITIERRPLTPLQESPTPSLESSPIDDNIMPGSRRSGDYRNTNPLGQPPRRPPKEPLTPSSNPPSMRHNRTSGTQRSFDPHHIASGGSNHPNNIRSPHTSRTKANERFSFDQLNDGRIDEYRRNSDSQRFLQSLDGVRYGSHNPTAHHGGPERHEMSQKTSPRTTDRKHKGDHNQHSLRQGGRHPSMSKPWFRPVAWFATWNGDTSRVPGKIQALSRSSYDIDRPFGDHDPRDYGYRSEGEWNELQERFKRANNQLEIARIQKGNDNKIIGETKAVLEKRNEDLAQSETLRAEVGAHLEELETCLKNTKQTLRLVEAQRDKFETYLNQALDEVETNKTANRQDMAKIRKDHQNDVLNLKEEAKVTLAKEKSRMESVMDTLYQDYQDEIKKSQRTREREKLAHQGELQSLNNTIDGLKRHMAGYSNTGDYTSISDDDFRTSFQLLIRRVNNIVGRFPERQMSSLPSASLDPSSFLERKAPNGGRNWPKFVRGMCWGISMRGFFSRPLGFGSFGSSGDGFDFLNELYQISFQNPNEMQASLPTSRRINTWRSVLFDGIHKSVQVKTSSTSTESLFGQLFQKNVELVREELVNSLQGVTGTKLDRQACSEITSFVESIGLLSIQMGSQQAHILMDFYDHKQVLKNTECFTQGGEALQSNTTTDIMVQPCLRRLGDGNADFSTQRVIVKGDIVSL